MARYECNRELIRAQFERLMIQRNLKCESPMALRKLVYTTTECVRSLEVMKLSKEELYDLMVIHLISKKLDADSRRQWERSLVNTSLPNFHGFVKFLDNHARIVAATLATPGKVVAKVPVTRNYAVMQDVVLKVKCEVCKGDHLVFKCEEFLKLSIPQRIETETFAIVLQLSSS